MSAFDGLDEVRQAAHGEMAEIMRGLRAAQSEIREQHAAYRREKEERDEERARARRRGDLGPELQRVQERIDAGRTTWEDVISGRDDHSDSQFVRRRIETNLDSLAEHLEDDEEFQEQADAVRANSKRIDDEMRGF